MTCAPSEYQVVVDRPLTKNHMRTAGKMMSDLLSGAKKQSFLGTSLKRLSRWIAIGQRSSSSATTWLTLGNFPMSTKPPAF